MKNVSCTCQSKGTEAIMMPVMPPRMKSTMNPIV
jgi:hypothetical protein